MSFIGHIGLNNDPFILRLEQLFIQTYAASNALTAAINCA